MRNAENRECVKCGIFMRNESAFYPLHIFHIPHFNPSFGLLRHNNSPVKNVDFGLLIHRDSSVKNIRKYKLRNSAEITHNSWQRKCECDSAGFHTRQLVSRVGTRSVFPHDRDTGISYCRLLLGDTMLKDDNFRQF